MMFIKKAPNSHGWVNPRDVEQLWMDHFDCLKLPSSPSSHSPVTRSNSIPPDFYREYDEFIFPMTIHPDVSGRPHVLLMHERIIEHINKHEGVEWVTMAEMCDDFKSTTKPEEGALMPKRNGEKV